MLRGNYAPIDRWVRSQSEKAKEQGFAPEDLLRLLLICRSSAIELDSWNKDIFSAVDEVIEEVFGYLHPKILAGIEEAEAKRAAASADGKVTASSPEAGERTTDRRRFARNRLSLPIRVISSGNGSGQEVTHTKSVSRGGLYFVTSHEYKMDQVLKINFPYWSDSGAFNKEYPAKIVRLDPLPDHTWGVAVDFQ